jgi:hypothetical protein
MDDNKLFYFFSRFTNHLAQKYNFKFKLRYALPALNLKLYLKMSEKKNATK